MGVKKIYEYNTEIFDYSYIIAHVIERVDNLKNNIVWHIVSNGRNELCKFIESSKKFKVYSIPTNEQDDCYSMSFADWSELFHIKSNNKLTKNAKKRV